MKYEYFPFSYIIAHSSCMSYSDAYNFSNSEISLMFLWHPAFHMLLKTYPALNVDRSKRTYHLRHKLIKYFYPHKFKHIFNSHSVIQGSLFQSKYKMLKIKVQYHPTQSHWIMKKTGWLKFAARHRWLRMKLFQNSSKTKFNLPALGVSSFPFIIIYYTKRFENHWELKILKLFRLALKIWIFFFLLNNFFIVYFLQLIVIHIIQ